ncbi:ABC transporter ATP-binding protein [Rhodococcus sovatensis]|uniref:ABC transporter ATP-binding protein n=1 Tax=Rhodococcus sovatensis TaxID=1805840 RepID=A0ABZ2PPE8_9NOCA
MNFAVDANDPPRLPVADRRQMVSEVRTLAAGSWWRVGGIMVLLLVAAASTLVLPLTVGWIVDTASRSGQSGIPTVFWWQLAGLGAAAIVGGAVEFFGVVALGRLIDTMVAELRERYLTAALALPEAEIERVGAGDIVTRAATDTRNVSEEFPTILPAVAAAAFTITLTLVGTAVIDWRFSVAFALAVPLYVAALRWYLPAVPPVYAVLRSADSTRGERVLTTLSALPTVKAFHAGPGRVARIRTAAWEVARWEVRAKIMQNRLFSRINLAEVVGLLVVVACGFFVAAPRGTSLGEITAASLLFLQVAAPISGLLYVMDDLQSATASLARVVGVTHDLPRHSEPTEPAETSSPATESLVHVHDVSFAYRADHPVLDGVSLHVSAGEHVAIVGTSGSGKTTLARLVAGVREPDSGRIDLAVTRAQIAYLSQEGHVFSGTLRENLLLAAPGSTDDMLRSALQITRADTLLKSLPDGLDTVLGEEGHRITAADVQLLSLARMVLSDPAVAILDEATADADSSNAALLDDAAAQALRGRSAIVIAHRLSQARVCDRIVVLEGGALIEEGTHDELLEAGGRYAHLWLIYSAQL